MSIMWCLPSNKHDNCLWYFNGERCEVTRLGVEDSRVKIIEVKLTSGAMVHVMCGNQGYPGLEYEVLH